MKYISIFLIIFFIQQTLSQNCLIQIGTKTNSYNNYQCGYNNYPTCNSIQDGMTSLKNNLLTTCTQATIQLSSGTFLATSNNIVGNFSTNNLGKLTQLLITGQSGSTTIDGTKFNNGFISINGNNQNFQLSISSITFQNWESNQFNLISNDINSIGQIYISGCILKNLRVFSIFNINGNYNNQLLIDSSQFESIVTEIYPIEISNSNLTISNSSFKNLDDFISFIFSENSFITFFNSSFSGSYHPIEGKNTTVYLYENNDIDKTTLCQCEDCTFETSSSNTIVSTNNFNPLELKCLHKKEIAIIVVLCVLGVAIILGLAFCCFSKRVGIIKLGNKKKNHKLYKALRAHHDSDDENSSMLNDSHL